MTQTLDAREPNPGMIGGVPQAPLALLPDPQAMFAARAERLAFLANGHALAPYLTFLAALTRLQARLAVEGPAPDPVPAERVAQARAVRMPPIDRAALVEDTGLIAMLDRLVAEASEIEMPDPAQLALSAVAAVEGEDRHWLLTNILSDTVPADSVAPHLFVAAAVQVHLARLAATLPADQLVPIRRGVCPACGGRAATSSVMGSAGIENTRYAACACCGTRWNEVRVHCLSCGDNSAISYRSAETAEATIKAEVCGSCHAWVKILYQVKNPSLDPIADDVGSLGLDLMMQGTEFRREGFNPWLAGY